MEAEPLAAEDLRDSDSNAISGPGQNAAFTFGFVSPTSTGIASFPLSSHECTHYFGESSKGSPIVHAAADAGDYPRVEPASRAKRHRRD